MAIRSRGLSFSTSMCSDFFANPSLSGLSIDPDVSTMNVSTAGRCYWVVDKDLTGLTWFVAWLRALGILLSGSIPLIPPGSRDGPIDRSL